MPFVLSKAGPLIRFIWFVAIWAWSVAAVGAVAFAIRLVIVSVADWREPPAQWMMTIPQ